MTLSYAHGVSTKPLIGKTIGTLLDDIISEFEQSARELEDCEKSQKAGSALTVSLGYENYGVTPALAVES